MHVLACLLSLAGSDVPPELLLKQRNQALEAEGVLRTMMRLHYVRLTHTHTHTHSLSTPAWRRSRGFEGTWRSPSSVPRTAQALSVFPAPSGALCMWVLTCAPRC